MVFDELTEEEQLAYANAVEIWARTFREALRWRTSRSEEIQAADPPLSAGTLDELDRHIERGFAERQTPLPSPDEIHAEYQARSTLQGAL